MATVTSRIKEIKQPYGGYIKVSDLKVVDFDNNTELNQNENIHVSIVGMAVDYLTRFMELVRVNNLSSNSKRIQEMAHRAFDISMTGAEMATYDFQINDAIDIAYDLLKNIKGLDDNSIISACQLVTFDIWFRNPFCALTNGYKPSEETKKIPDSQTIENIRIMVERSQNFFEKYGPIVATNFRFDEKGYTKTVRDGDGDYLTNDILLDFKVSASKPTNKHTLQILMYWIMGLHSEKKEYKTINKLGIYNPRLNKLYYINVNDISTDTIKEVEDKVICY